MKSKLQQPILKCAYQGSRLQGGREPEDTKAETGDGADVGTLYFYKTIATPHMLEETIYEKNRD